MGHNVRSPLTCTAGVLLLFAAACGGGGAQPAPQDPAGDDPIDMDAGAGPRDAGPKRDAQAATNPDGPIVSVLSPIATDDPASEDVISSNMLTVRCEAKRNPKGELVDAKSVKVNVYAGTEMIPKTTQVATSTGQTDVYEAQNINLAEVPHGEIRIECEAADLATMPEKNSASISTLLDNGPEITFLNPMQNGFVAAGVGMGEDVRVRFRVAPMALSDDDRGAGIAEVKAWVGGKPIATLDESTTEENVYSFGLDFNDTQLFTVVPETLSVKVEATNSRTPKARTNTGNLAVGVDSEGPVIMVKSPARVAGLDPVVSGKVDVVLDIKDSLAGVDQDSVEIRVQRKTDSGKDVYRAQVQATNTFVASFETGSYTGLPRLSITLVARDKAGIETQSNLSVDVDTVAPWLSLDPPTVREWFPNNNAPQCTGPFDPLGDAVNNGDVLSANAFRPRVLIWDRPLTIPGVTSVRYAMIKADTPRLYIQHDPEVPLLVDSDHDPNHECDAINLSADNIDKAPVTLVLAPVTPAGTGPMAGEWQGAMFTERLDLDPSVVGECHTIPGNNLGPNPLSTDTTMTRVIKHYALGVTPVVYAEGVAASGFRSTGSDYVSPRAGWKCLVATAEDNAGNFAFSPPMRICLNFGDGTPCAASIDTIDCTDGCVIPAQFQPSASLSMPRVIRYPQ